MIMERIKLLNGVEMPSIGLGTWQITDRRQMIDVVGGAYDTGYRMFDTAASYCNEIALSKAIAENGINREDIFISNKVWNTSRGFDAVKEACVRSLNKLKTEYFDLYLVHWPASMKLYSDWEEINADTWRGMEQIYKDGLARAIGVCNFKIHHLETLKKTAEIMPMINQVELHPGLNQNDLLNYCKHNGIIIEASSPLGNGQILHNSELLKLSEDKKKSVAQICLRWELQKGVIVIPKTTNINRMKENLDVFDFELSESEMKVIDSIPYCGGIGIDSDEVEEFG